MLTLLNIDVRELMSAAINAENIIPLIPTKQIHNGYTYSTIVVVKKQTMLVVVNNTED